MGRSFETHERTDIRVQNFYLKTRKVSSHLKEVGLLANGRIILKLFLV